MSFFDAVITKMRTSEEDIIPLESCQCEEVLEMVIMPLAHHFVALGEKTKALYYFLEITSAYLILGDNYMVRCFYPDPPLHPRVRHHRACRGALEITACS